MRTICYERFMMVVALLLFMQVHDAQAYLDPGTGSYIFQILIAGLIGGAFVIKMGWSRIVQFIKRLFLRKSDK